MGITILKVIAIVGFIFMIIGLFSHTSNPNNIKKNVFENPKFLLPLIICVVFSFLIVVLSDKKQEQSYTSNKYSSSSYESPKVLLNSVDEFVSQFNYIANEADFDVRIYSTKKEASEPNDVNDVYILDLNKNIAIAVSTYRNSKTVKDITLVGTGNGTFKSGANLLLSITTMMKAIDSSLNEDDLKDVRDRIVKFDTQSHSITKNGLKYSFIASDATGVLFIAERE